MWIDPDLLLSRHPCTGEPVVLNGFEDMKRKWKGLLRHHSKMMAELLDGCSPASSAAAAPLDDETSLRLHVSAASAPRLREG